MTMKKFLVLFLTFTLSCTFLVSLFFSPMLSIDPKNNAVHDTEANAPFADAQHTDSSENEKSILAGIWNKFLGQVAAITPNIDLYSQSLADEQSSLNEPSMTVIESGWGNEIDFTDLSDDPIASSMTVLESGWGNVIEFMSLCDGSSAALMNVLESGWGDELDFATFLQ